MTELDDILASLVEGVDGAVAAAVAGMDGLLVEQHPLDEVDLAPAAAELTNIMSGGRMLMDSAVDGGALREVILTADRNTVYARAIAPDLYCLVVIDSVGDLEAARRKTQVAAERLGEVLA